jgi:hypothetical protein
VVAVVNAPRRSSTVAGLLLLWATTGCAVAIRGGSLPPTDYRPTVAAHETAPAAPRVDYHTQFVGRLPKGSDAFAERVRLVFARHPVLREATSRDDAPSLHLDVVLTNETNGLAAGLSGLACGLSFGLLPGYARDRFELVVELRNGAEVFRRFEYRDSVVTVTHLAVIGSAPTSQPRAVIAAVVDNMLLHALRDLDAAGLLPDPTPEGCSSHSSEREPSDDGAAAADATSLWARGLRSNHGANKAHGAQASALCLPAVAIVKETP